MTSSGFDPNQNPQGNPPEGGQGGTPPPGSYPPPGQYPPPSSYPPPGQTPPPGQYPPPQQGAPQYGQPGGYPGQPQPQGGYPSPPPFDSTQQYGGFPNPSSGSPGDLWIRFGARIIDGILVGIVALLISAVFGSIGSITITGLFSGLLGFVYFVAMETTQGGTLGKRVLGLSVQGPGGAPRTTPQQSAIRNAFLLFGIIPFIGSLLVLVSYIVIAVTINSSPTKQGKHDELAGGTRVVKN